MLLSVIPLHNCNCPILHHNFEEGSIVNIINVRVVLTASVLVSIRVTVVIPPPSMIPESGSAEDLRDHYCQQVAPTLHF